MSPSVQPPTRHDHQHPAPPVDNAPPKRSKITAGLAALACIACCALPLLITAGVLTGASAAILEQTLIATAISLTVLALGMWWLHRRRNAQHSTTDSTNCGCGDGGCG